MSEDKTESLTFPYDLKDCSKSKYLDYAEKWKGVGAKNFYIKKGKLEEL